MSLLNQYDFDSLPYIDKEYDHPIVQNAVLELIQEEMNIMSKEPKKDYLLHLPLPINLINNQPYMNSTILQKEYDRKINNISMSKVDITRYDVQPPVDVLEKDVQAWRSSINNAKSQLEHQLNRSMNLELADKNITPMWLEYNSSLEGLDNNINLKTTILKRKIDLINSTRKIEQETSFNELEKMKKRRDLSIKKQWQIKSVCDRIENDLIQHGTDPKSFNCNE
jgi:hypothetical protein